MKVNIPLSIGLPLYVTFPEVGTVWCFSGPGLPHPTVIATRGDKTQNRQFLQRLCDTNFLRCGWKILKRGFLFGPRSSADTKERTLLSGVRRCRGHIAVPYGGTDVSCFIAARLINLNRRAAHQRPHVLRDRPCDLRFLFHGPAGCRCLGRGISSKCAYRNCFVRRVLILPTARLVRLRVHRLINLLPPGKVFGALEDRQIVTNLPRGP